MLYLPRSDHIYRQHALKNQGALEESKKEQGAKKNVKGAEKNENEREQEWKNEREQGAKGENVCREQGSPNRAYTVAYL